ncbi:MAG: hypothetical protein FJ280_13650 [Planctomycetes bacterium]|nr:hypothetical protein [Planctomycetota bacterium]
MVNTANLGRGIVTYLSLCVIPLIHAMPAGALPPDPNNAALLYYQACLMCPELPSGAGSVVQGTDPNDQVREYLKRSPWPETLELVQAATDLSRCDWGFLFSRGLLPPPSLIFSLNRLTFLLGVQARTLAADGQIRSALENCIRMRRFAAHLGDDTFLMWVLSEKMDVAASSAIQYVLGVTPPDETTLLWLQAQLRSVPGAPWRPEEALHRFGDMDVQGWRAHPSKHKAWREAFLEDIEDEAVRKERQNLDESPLFDQALQSFDAALRQTLDVLRSDVPYSQKCAELAQIIDRAWEKAEQGDPVATFVDSVEHVGEYYRIHVNATAPLNALMNAIELYLIKARTGHLPRELPAYLPEDPYSGKSFEYETTKEGFVLRCRTKPVDSSSIRQFPFRVRAQAN